MELDRLEPRAVLRWFAALCAIPHGSGNTKAISDYCVRFAAERGLEHYQDALNNVIIIAPATPGYEAAEPVILQGHLDMVCAAAPDCSVNFSADGLELFTDGDVIGARGTTLGADDGIAVAMALALLDDPSIPRPRLEAVFTVDEETGMYGAQGLDPAPLRGRTVLNLDSEEEGTFTVACAGGARVSLSTIPAWESCPLLPVTLRVDGLLGGHSGIEIDRNRGNAIRLMSRLLRELSKHTSLRLCSLSGGTADNAIPFSCEAKIAVLPGDADAVLAIVERMNGVYRSEFALSDGDVQVSASLGAEQVCTVLTAGDTQRILLALNLVPNGVQAMSAAMPGLPETSLNLGMIDLNDAGFRAAFSVRSSVASRKAAVIDRLRCAAEASGLDFAVSGDYPAWEYRPDSPLRERMVRIFTEQYGHPPRVVSIHAGLECGILSQKLPGMDCVSFGPDITDIHTAAERLHLASARRVWAFLLEVLKQSR